MHYIRFNSSPHFPWEKCFVAVLHWLVNSYLVIDSYYSYSKPYSGLYSDDAPYFIGFIWLDLYKKISTLCLLIVIRRLKLRGYSNLWLFDLCLIKHASWFILVSSVLILVLYVHIVRFEASVNQYSFIFNLKILICQYRIKCNWIIIWYRHLNL